jgi:hypothetical protein
MSLGTSTKIFQFLKKGDFLDTNGELIRDPRGSDWRGVLKGADLNLGTDSLQADLSPISEVLNVAYAMHELTSEYMTETLAFFNPLIIA